MRTEHLLVSLIGLFLGFTAFVCGILLFLVPYIPQFAQAASALVLRHMEGISCMGLGFAFLGIILLSLLGWLNRRRYLLLKMGGVSVEDRIIAQFAQECLQRLFPGQLVECDVIVKRKKKIEILTNLPFIAEDKQEYILQEIEKTLAATLHKQCQYDKQFILNVSFSNY